jgi:hypothetical protein
LTAQPQAAGQGSGQDIADKAGRHLIADRWWESVAGMKVVTLKKGRRYGHELSIDPPEASEQLDEIKAEGFRAIHIFAPAEGLFAYNGLDTTNHYRIDPEIGTMDDYKHFIRLAHSKGLAVVAFINIGYFSLEAPDWLEACDNPDSEKAKWFIWADSADAPIPAEHTYFNWPREPDWGDETWGWQYSERAGRYFWAKWQATDEDGKKIGLPQNDWGYDGWAEEAGKTVRFWMDTGMDGLIIDAPIFYIGMSWEKNNRYISDVIASYGNTYRQPEGSERAGWITEGNYNSLQDYRLGEGREEAIRKAIATGDPRGIETALQGSHDIIVAHGGVLYKVVPSYDDVAKRHLYRATVAAIGDILAYTRRSGSPDAEETWILNTKQSNPALHQLSIRRKIDTNDDEKYYAFVRTAADTSQRMLVVLNFQPTPQEITVDLSGVHAGNLVNLRDGARYKREDHFNVNLPGYGYGFFELAPPGE